MFTAPKPTGGAKVDWSEEFSNMQLVDRLPNAPTNEDLIQVFDGDSYDEDDYDEDKVSTPIKGKRSKPKVFKKTNYVKGGKTTKSYHIAKKLLYESRVSNKKTIDFLKDQFLILQLDRRMMTQVALSFSNVAEDLSNIDEQTAIDIAIELKETQEDEIYKSFIQEASTVSLPELIQGKKNITTEIEILQKKMRFIEYFEHVQSDIKSEAVKLSDSVFDIVKIIK